MAAAAAAIAVAAASAAVVAAAAAAVAVVVVVGGGGVVVVVFCFVFWCASMSYAILCMHLCAYACMLRAHMQSVCRTCACILPISMAPVPMPY